MPRGYKARPQAEPRVEPEPSAEAQSVSWEWIEENLGLERPKEFQTEAQAERPAEPEPPTPAAPEARTSKKTRPKRGAREEPTEGLRPAGIQRLRDLRAENNELKSRIDELERKVQDSSIDLGVVGIVGAQAASEIVPNAPASDLPGGSAARAAEGKSGPGAKQIVCEVLFYLAIVLMLTGAAMMRSTREGAPATLAGYSGMIVLTGSMQDVIPQGSFILTKSVDADTLQVGDDITFMIDAATTVTHRIIDILPQIDGTLAFRTQGTNNALADADLVYEKNVVGVVIYHNLTIGKFAKWLSANWPVIIFLLAVVAVLSRVLAAIAASDDDDTGRRVKKKERRAAKSGALPEGNEGGTDRAPPGE